MKCSRHPLRMKRGEFPAEYSLIGEAGGCGLEGTYTVVAVDSVTGQSATTMFTDAFVPPSVPPTEHWVIFQTPGLPANTYVHVTYNGTAPNGNPIPATTVNFREPLPVRTKPGSSFTYRNFDITAVSGGVTYTLVPPTTPTGPFTTGGGGTYWYITATYVIRPSNSAPAVSANSAHVQRGRGPDCIQHRHLVRLRCR